MVMVNYFSISNRLGHWTAFWALFDMFNQVEGECQIVPKYYGWRYMRWDRGLRLGDDGGKWIGGRSNPRRKRLKCWIRSRQMGSFKISSAILSQLRHITVHLLNIQERKRQPFIHSYRSYNFWLTIPDQKLTCSQVFCQLHNCVEIQKTVASC